jgi:hypothetical protein
MFQRAVLDPHSQGGSLLWRRERICPRVEAICPMFQAKLPRRKSAALPGWEEWRQRNRTKQWQLRRFQQMPFMKDRKFGNPHAPGPNWLVATVKDQNVVISKLSELPDRQ